MKVIALGGKSPIYELAHPVGRAIVLSAPERVEDVRPLLEDLILEIVEPGPARCYIDLPSKTIRITRSLLEHLWVSSYSYWMLYSRHVSGRLIDTPKEVDLTHDPVDVAAMQLLRWSVQNQLGGLDRPWPDDLPRPASNPTWASDIHVANEFMIAAVAFILHHELAHHRLGHSSLPEGADSVSQEREADYEAARWLLADCGGAVLEKRALGVTIALASMVVIQIYRGPEDPTTHPRTFDRLINSLQQYVPDVDHAAWGFAVIAIKLHMDHVGIAAPQAALQTVRDVAEAYAEVLAARVK
ncbi:hypothetical protein DRW03_35660 [Corallococcus sp. H22C18031201]|nr:hypothetical protein DRW03_35660 [Corallococcus sp. H22C18031201]